MCRTLLTLTLAATAAALGPSRRPALQATTRRGILGTGILGIVGPAPALAVDKQIALAKSLFDGGGKDAVLWYEANLSPDFKASFNGGRIVLPRDAYVGVTKAILLSVPDFTYTAPKNDFKKKKNSVTWTAVVRGTHTGVPYSPIPKVPPVKPNKKNPKSLENDPEAITLTFDENGKIDSLSVVAIPGGKGFSGPVGFYLQMGGDPKKLPPL